MKLLFFMLILPSSLFYSQVVDFNFVEKKIGEASNLYHQSRYNEAIQTLENLFQSSLKSKNNYGAGIALQKKISYQIESGKISSEPDWKHLESFKTQNKTQNSILKIHLLKLKASYNKSSEKAEKFLEEGMKLQTNSPEENKILGEIYLAYGNIKHKNGDNVEAVKNYLKAQQIFEITGNSDVIGLIYGELANSSFMMKEFDRAIEYAEKGIEIEKKNKNYENLCIQLSNLGRIYQGIGKHDLAVKYFQESSEYASKSSKKETRFVNLVDIALLYHSKKDRENALRYMEEALEEGRKINQPKLHRYIRLAAMFSGYTGNEVLMNQYYNESLALALKEKDKDALRDWNGSQNFYYANIKKDFTKAYPFLEKFHSYKDSLLSEKSKKDFNELEIKYQTEKKQFEINKLSAEKTIQKLEIERKNALLRGNILEANKKQKEIQLLTKIKEINRLEIERQSETLGISKSQIKYLEQQKKLADQENLLKENRIKTEKLTRNLIIASLIAVIGIFAFFINRIILKKKIEQKNMLLKERNRISSELHDEVGSTLTAINLLSHSAIKNLEQNERNPAHHQVEKIRDNTQTVMENISDIVWSMNPENESFQNIKIRMMEFASSILDTKDIEYTFAAEDILNEVKMNTEKRRDFYLIFKEAVNNLVKYSKADLAKITITRSGNFIKMTIQDNGIGFNESTVKKGNGLLNMRKRALRNNGTLEITSEKQETKVVLIIPYA